MGAVTQTYRASANLTVTNLHSIATSSTWVAGWTSAVIDNSSDLDLDKAISCKFTFGNVTTAGDVRIYAFCEQEDGTIPALFSAGTPGTEGTATVTTATIRDAAMVLVNSFTNRVANGDVYWTPKTSLRGAFGGFLAKKVYLFIAHSTGVNLAASGNQVTVTGYAESVA